MIRDLVRTTIAMATLPVVLAATPAGAGPGPSGIHPANAGAREEAVDLALEPVAGGFAAPLQATGAGDGTGRIFVVERGGLVFVVRNGERRSTPWLDISARTLSGGEQGLLGLAFHPDFETNRNLYVNYTGRSGNTVIARYRQAKKRPGRVKPSSRRVILRIEQPYANHNGGAMAFGPDGYLHVATGDGGSGGDPQANGQRLDTLLGKILRIDVDGASGDRRYAIPGDNPFDGRDGREEIWAYGLRNPWRFSFDFASGDIWIGDVGQGTLEEINRQPAGSPGLNYGWNVMEGDACYPSGSACDRAGLTMPIATYGHGPECSVTGGHVYRGTEFPDMVGQYFFGDFCSGRIWSLVADQPAPQDPVELLDTGHSISSFGEAENGELFMTDLGSGMLFRLVDSS
jgi:glucose/arabinose dehydrogenase